jgi:hypothetical protein
VGFVGLRPAGGVAEFDQATLDALIEILKALGPGTDDRSRSAREAASLPEILASMFWREYFTHAEGSACCADKTRHTIRCLVKSAENDGENVPLFATYDLSRHPHMAEYADEAAYWVPTTVPDTDTAIDILKFGLASGGRALGRAAALKAKLTSASEKDTP